MCEDRIPFVITTGAAPGTTDYTPLVSARPGYRVEVDSISVSSPALGSGGPYNDTITIYGFEDPVTGLPSGPPIPQVGSPTGAYNLGYPVQIDVQLSMSGPSNFPVSVSGRTPVNCGLTANCTDASDGADLTTPALTISGAYVRG